MEKTTSELIPVSDLHSSKITRWSRTLYNRLIGLPESGTLRIDANVDKATIYVDGSVSTTLRDGSAKVVGLEEGVHQVAIEADGYKRYESDVSILAGETETLSLSLSKTKSTGGGIGDEKDPNDIWKYSFYAGAVTTVGAGGLWFYYGKQAGYIGGSSLIDAKNDTWRELQEAGEMGVDGNPEQAAVNQISDGAGGGVINGSCDKASDSALPSSTRLDAFRVACKDGDDAASRATYLAYGTGVFALATAYLGYRAYLANGSNKEKQYGKKKSKKKSRVVVVPQLGPKGIGAGLSVEF